ncbi:phage terminase large subunit family protein [Ramlibacter sp. G-1-2-2]|uniref:Phage terminase large subunit family protein n=1 Tax=Ramlibacter agri TaxID=2728837 RepID=A0A848H4E3_9BURK|nr:phage terminase large subunit family protein [Ramlibacter agri]
MAEPSYASAAEIALGTLDILLPPPRQSVAEYARENRYLSNQGGGYVGRWTDDMAPYLVEPMETLTSLDHLTLAIVGPGQSGKTEIAQNWLLKSVSTDPADMLWFMQSDQSLEAFCKARINPMIDGHPPMAERLGRRPVDDSLHFKQFQGMRLELLSASPNNLINKSAPRIVADEIDAYPQSLGDIKALLDVRRQTFGRQSKLLAISHPDQARGLNPARDWTAGIMAIFGDSDQRLWYWPCPCCGAWSSPAPIAPRHMAIDYPEAGTLDEIEEKARLLCPVNGCLIEDHHRKAMNRAGRWIGLGQEIDQQGKVVGKLARKRTAGFWIVGAMSLFVMGGIGGLARARAKAQREMEVSGEDESLRQVMVKQWGVPYAHAKGLGSVSANDLADRADPDLKTGVVPDGARFLTAVADVQAAHFEYLVRGWGVMGESWVIEHGKIEGDPATSSQDWDTLLQRVFLRAYPLADGSGRAMRVLAAGYDSGGLPGVTQQAYAAWLRWRKAGHVRRIGQISGRDAWTIIPLKGNNRLMAPRLTVSYPDTGRAANLRAGGGNVPVGMFNPNLFKDDLAGQLQAADAGPWHVHFPHALRSAEAPHVWFEQLVAEHRLPNGSWDKTSPTVRNEAMDLMTMAHVLAHLMGLGRVDWGRPYRWMAPWDKNPLVQPMAAPAARATPPAAPSVSAIPAPAAVPQAAAPAPAASPLSPLDAEAKRVMSLVSRLA